MAVKMTLKLNNIKGTSDRILGSRAVGMFVSETCARYMAPYVPMDGGQLYQNYTAEPFKVTYNQPYASRQYHGTHFNFRKDKHPLATAEWDKAMLSVRRDELASEISAFITRS